MDASSVILVFRRVETLEKIRRALASRGYPILGAFASGGHALRFAGGRDVDIAIVGSDLQDVGVEALCRELSERLGCEVILLLQGSGEEASLAERLGPGVACLPRPVTVELLLSAVQTAARFRQRIKGLDREVRRYKDTLERRAWSERAKHVLMATKGLTEDVAWRYLQKTSMDTGRPMVDIAKEILSQNEGEPGGT
jgi:two-component system, response regulator PdtaR